MYEIVSHKPEKKINDYKNIKELIIPKKAKYIIFQDLCNISSIIYHRSVCSIYIDSCPNITEIPYISNIKEIILLNQHDITMLPREYKNQLIYLKIKNCRWLNPISEKNSINDWFNIQDKKFIRKIKNKKMKKNKHNFLQYYDKIFENKIDINILTIIVNFLI